MNTAITRRAMLGAMSVAALGVRSQAAKAPKMRFGFTTYQWGREWDLGSLIANGVKAGARGVELRTQNKHAHGVELELSAAARAEVKKKFAGSAMSVVGLATSVRFDSLDPEVVRKNIEQAEAYAKLSHDVGGSGIRVFPNDYHEGVPHEKTIAQIAEAVNEAGKRAARYGQLIRLENHGTAGRLTALRKVMESVEAKNVRIKLNCDPLDNEGGRLRENFELMKPYLDNTIHMHDLADTTFPYALQMKLLAAAGWEGWCLIEESKKVPDVVAALAEQRRLWEKLTASTD